jgi:hypothetical protein
MDEDEEQLFRLIDEARRERGCAPLGRDSDLSRSARSDAKDRAKENNLSGGGSSMAAAGGDGWSAQSAFDQMKDRNSGTIFDCSLHELGVGRGTRPRCSIFGFGGTCIGTKTERVAWVADFQ